MVQIGEFLIQSEHEIPFARQLTQRLCLLVKLSIGNQARLSTAVSQVTQSLFHYCRCVQLSFDVVSDQGQHWLRATIEERAPITPLPEVRQGSKLSRDDLLAWLAGIGSIVSAFTTDFDDGQPIRVTVAKPFPPWQRSVSEETLHEWTRILREEPPKQPIEVILQQNRELVGILDALREKDAVLEKKILEIEALEKMRDDLVHALVHDLRNPLSSIRTSLSGLLHNHADNLTPYQNMMIEISYLGSMKLTQLVDNILEVYKLERESLTIEPVLISLRDLVDRLIRLQGPLLEEKSIRTDVQIPDNIPLVDGDENLLERVFQNLLDNAIKFTPHGGSISIVVDQQLTGELRGLRGEFAQFLLVRIRDSGPGVPDHIKPTLFEKFSTGEYPKGGSGLGLAFCKLVVQAHGGDIWVEGSPGEGAEFVFLLPTVLDPDLTKDVPNA